jgi:uncharacterized membrane protein
MSSPQDLEAKFSWLSLVLVGLFGLAFAAGLVLMIAQPGSPRAPVVLQAGLILLMCAPALRLVLALAERVRTRDWMFVAMTVIVAVELAVVMWRASRRL